MKTRVSSRVLFMFRSYLMVALVACLVADPVGAQPGKALAEKIVAESGFPGGLIVLVGGWDADLAVSLGKAPNVLVHWLVRDTAKLENARRDIRAAGVSGRVSVMLWEGPDLPYTDGMVNLLLLQRIEGPDINQSELARVLAPRGAEAQFRGALRIGPYNRKLPPEDVDEWTHSRHDATGNAVSKDRRVGPPRSVQWEALPRWNRGTKTSAMVSAHGRIFYILDDSHFACDTSSWSLIARDAYNGIRLWRHELPTWGGAKFGKKVGPAQVNRRLVAVGDRVYAPLGDGAPVSVLDAATGRVIRVLDDTANVEEFLMSKGILVALVHAGYIADFWRSLNRDMRIVAVKPQSGQVLWEHEASTVLPMTLTADSNQVVYHDGTSIRSLDLRTGSRRWISPPTGQAITLKDSWNPDRPGAEKLRIILAPQLAPTLLIYENVVAFAGGRQLNVISAKDGRELWRAPYAATGYSVPVDLFGFDGALWGPDASMNFWRPTNDDIAVKAYDLLTGTVKKTVTGHYGFPFQHHRCHQMKVIGDTVMAGRAGIEFLDTATGDVTAHHWVRGSCYFGELPANGLLYVPPHNCACYIRAKLSGFMALSPQPSSAKTPAIPDDQRLQRGPAYGQTMSSRAEPGAEDWPTYRHDAARSGKATTRVGSELQVGWRKPLGGNLTSPVVANGRVLLASTDEHVLYALEAETGEVLWQYSFNARIDSPPTLYDGLVLTGCRDGSVIALRATDGSLVWRFLAAPGERMIVSRGQLESVWPVYGSVLVMDKTVYFAAGKSSYLDGGLRFYGLEPRTGRMVVDTVLNSRRPDGSETLDEQGVDGFLNDILSSDGKRLFMRHQILDKAGKPQAGRITHLHSPDGYLSSDTTSRLTWIYAPLYTSVHQGAFYDVRLSRVLFPSGRILVEGDDKIYGFGQNHYARLSTAPGGTFALFACPKHSDVPLNQTARAYRKLAMAGKDQVRFTWWKHIPIQVWAMVKTQDILFVAGARGSASISQAALEGKAPGMLLAVSPADGTVLAEMALPSMPVWDGMAAAGGKLYLALADGSIVCLGAPAPGRHGTEDHAAGGA
jgi:outer membrane protein assembly factor BamB